MCLIITQPKGQTLSRAHLLDIFSRNGDGFGIMRAHRGKLAVHRIVTSDADEMLNLYHEHAAGRECVLHWRMATHGAVDVANAHPFRLTADVAMVHNGILDCGTPTAGKSDTWHMVRHILAPIARDNADHLFTAEFAAVLGGLIGSGNKFVLAHADGRVAIVNQSSGVHHAGRWYSNTYAWGAPVHLLPRVRQPAASWLDTWGDELPSTRATARGAIAAAPTARAADVLDLLSDCVLADDVDGIADWCEEFPELAAEQLSVSCGVTLDDARHYLSADRAAVVDHFRLAI